METQAYFDNIQLHIIREIRKASHTIHIAVAWFTDTEIFDLLCCKVLEGVRVELIIVNDAINRKSSIDYLRLSELGGLFLMIGDNRRGASIMHNKFCVIDGATLITGSYNWSRQAQKNWENITIITNNPELSGQYLHEFDAIIEQATNNRMGCSDHTKIVIRLEALRHFLELDDDDDIDLQMCKLKKLLPAGEEFIEVHQIVKLVELDRYEEAVIRIVSFTNARKQLVVYIDPEISELALELKALEIQLSALEDEKADSEKTLYNYQCRYNIEVGHIVRRILKLRAEQFKKEAEKHKEKQPEYEDAQKEYDTFEQGYQQVHQQVQFNVTQAEQQELKALYRACSKMCHPDIVAAEFKDEAGDLFARLNAANEKNDITTVKAIFERLHKNMFTPMSASVSDAQKLHHQVVRMRGKLKDLAIAIYELRKTDIWLKVVSIDDWDAYFGQIKEQLSAELEVLEAQHD